MKKRSSGYGIFLAVLAAALYAINAPFSKILLDFVPPTMMVGLLYIGAGIGMGAVALFRKGRKTENAEKPFTKKQLPYIIAMIVLDIA
ncbi:MAG: EamA family transporter, partial [Oscillospiraceae bacterium]|nr:EamA family transporter [Oscillospiraceae bacterium]